MATETIQSIVVRIALTQDEWADVQKLAIDRRVRPSELLGRTVREHLLNEKGESNE